jgi:diaminohydroxyphosphoribosylaminopyrimidine deaminase/5-amino-6-(5-phosphoribosylamino)uracil reductase
LSDELYQMRRALELAGHGIGLVSPNPAVGAIVVDSAGKKAGEGSHVYDSLKHAEILALEQAAGRARGGTLFINLEPCSHLGRTAPCADAVIAAGIRRVVCAMKDPNPLVSGNGFAKLRAAGIQVDVGLFEGEAKKLNESFAKYVRTSLPFVTLKSAMTLDGKIAAAAKSHGEARSSQAASEGARTGHHWITGEAARAHVQLLRHAHDAILVGVGTVIADDPLLTDRSGCPRRRPLLRVILDSFLRLPNTSRLVKTAQQDVLVLYSNADPNRIRELEGLGIRVEQVSVDDADGRPNMPDVLRHLGAQTITSLLIEGGALVNWAALSSGVVDKIFLYYAPMILGGTGSVPFAGGEGYQHLSEAARVNSLDIHRFGEDFAVEGYLQDPYRD